VTVIDVHTHFFPRITREEAAELDPGRAPWLKTDLDGTGMIMTGENPFRPVQAALWDPARRIEDMDRDGVEVQLFCATPVMFGYAYPIERARPWSQRMNDRALEFAAPTRGRLRPLTQVPLQYTDAARSEASRAKNAGHVERLPRSLKLVFAHGGGAFAFLLGRAENAWHERDIVRQDSPHPPSHYLDRFAVDSAVFDERALRLLVDVMGEDRVLLGSDQPFPLGERRVGRLVSETSMLGDSAKRKVLGENAARFFGIEPTRRSEQERSPG
jgi:predicted TIM-barrel fold metal-dependent hydrolase